MGITRIKIDVQRNTLLCGVNGGNAYLEPGDKVKWTSASRDLTFTLEFFQLGLEEAEKDYKEGRPLDVRALPNWPFDDPPEPKGGVWGPTNEFTGTIAQKKGLAFKYYVTIGNLRLDPILIVVR